MGRFVNPSNGAFQAALNSEIYVDKTGLIGYTNKVLGSTQAFICCSRPRRFGKSTDANMLAAYYSKGCDSSEMFAGFEIAEDESFARYLNQYDVIHIDVQWCMTSSKCAESVVRYIELAVIDELRKIYPDIDWKKEDSLAEVLSRIHTGLGNQFIIIFDEWDVLIREEAANQEVQTEYIEFLRSLFKGVEPTRYVALAYLTGILPIIRIKTQSALNNFEEFTMLDSSVLARYFGFTDEEVRLLCDRYGKEYTEVKRWYDGYRLDHFHVYNPKAVVSLMLRGAFKSYWTQTGTYEAIQPYINMDFDDLKTSIIAMLSGSSIPVEVSLFQNDVVRFSGKDDILTLLIHLGYLGYDPIKRHAFIPNEEIRQEFELSLRHQKWSELLAFQQTSENLLDAVLDGDCERVAEGIELIHNTYASNIQYNNENSLSSVLTIAFLSTMDYYFMPIRELPTGRGFADFVYIPKPEFAPVYPALLVELKWNRSAKTALMQVYEKRYTETLEQFSGKIMLVGISYDKKTKRHTCVIEEKEK